MVCGARTKQSYFTDISLRPRNIRILFSSTKGHFSLFERSTWFRKVGDSAAGEDPTQPPSTSAVFDRHVSAASEVSPRPFKSRLSMPERHLTTRLHPCSGVKVLLEATPTAGGGHHKLHAHANRCAQVAFYGKASHSPTDATAAHAFPAEHLWNAPAVLSPKRGMAAGSHTHARDAQPVP